MACDERSNYLRQLSRKMTKAQNNLFDLDNSLAPVTESEHLDSLRDLGQYIRQYLGSRGLTLDEE